MTLNFENGEQYEVRGGAWLDEMNSCFWQPVRKLQNGYVLCRENTTEGKLFAMYMPYYEG